MSQQNSQNYYANGGGGGFLANNSPFGSASGSPGGIGRRSDASQSLRPLTCRQILNATQAHTDAEWVIDDTEVGQLTLVGQVFSLNRQATNSVYWIDDGTGRIEARHWVDSTSEDEDDKWGGLSENAWVRITGSIKTFGQKRYVNTSHIRLVEYTEIAFHLMDAMVITRIFEKGPPSGPGQVNNSGENDASAYNVQSTFSSDDRYAKLPQLQRSIIKFISTQPSGDDGIPVGQIAVAVGGDPLALNNALDELMELGLIFSTIDDSHFKCIN